LGQVLNFGSLAYVTDYCGEFQPHMWTVPAGVDPRCRPLRRVFREQGSLS
jgi:hypothetical protein